MTDDFNITLTAPDKSLFAGSVAQINLPTIGGEIGVRVGHMPMVVGLAPGVVEILDNLGQEPEHFAVTGGFAEITANKVVVLVTDGEAADNLNEQAVLAAQQRAQQQKLDAKNDSEFTEAQNLLEQSLAQLKTIKRRKKWLK